MSYTASRDALHQNDRSRDTWLTSLGSGPYTSTHGSCDGQVAKWILGQMGKLQIGVMSCTAFINALHQDNIARETWPASLGSGPYTSTQGSSDGQVGKWILVQFGKWQIGVHSP